MDPVFNKFKEKLGSFKKAFSKTIDEKAVEVEPVIVEQVPESEESLEEEIEPIIEEKKPLRLPERRSPEIEKETASQEVARISIEDLKKAEYRKKVEDRKKAAEKIEEEEEEEEKPSEEKKSFFSKSSLLKSGLLRKPKLSCLTGKYILMPKIWKSLCGNSKWVSWKVTLLSQSQKQLLSP